MICANLAWNLVNFRAGLIRALVAGGFRVIAVAPPDAAMAARLEALGCTFEPAPIDAMGLNPLRDLATFLALRRLVRRHRPAAWLSWTIKPNVYGALAAGLEGVPAIPNISGLGTAFIRRNLLTALVKSLYRFCLRRAPTVFFQNAEDRDLFLDMGLVRAGQARLLPGSGIDPEEWRPADAARPARGHFLMLARVVADKGVREFADAARRLRARHPQARFTLMGFLDVANRTAISADEVRGWEAEGLLAYEPPVDDVRPAIAGADFIVLPSYREGLSRVLLEAGALARPCVTSDVPGCRDIVRDGENGFLCLPRDAEALERAMEGALAIDDAGWQAMARAARDRVMRDFSLDKVTDLYQQALADAGVRSGSAA
ncbi:MAG: hypothetical protein RIQ46_1590 [Pseudomonadota bacterium]|jgi:glycosyltransferase involved in cell wall biosynthesis